jgi:hypothetical protein
MLKKAFRKGFYFLFFLFYFFFFIPITFSQSIPVVSDAEILDKSTGVILPSLSKGGVVRLHASISDPDGIKYVRAIIKDLGTNNLSAIISLYDDGKDEHGDSPSFINGSSGAGDGKYSAIWLTPSSLNSGSTFAIIIEAADIFGNVYRSDNNATPYEDTFSVEENCTFGFTCLASELGNIKCGGNIIQQCVFDLGDNCNFWNTSTDCGLNVCCGLGAGAVCCGAGEICGVGGACVTCSDTTCNGVCLDSNCVEDPDCNASGCCGDGTCDTDECNSCPNDCAIADCCGNGVCNSNIGEDFSNCADCPCLDGDGDGYLSLVCGGLDCDDNNSEINPSKDEICDGINNDCDVTTIENDICDNDSDNYCNCDRVYEYGADLSSICSGTNTTNAFWWNKTCDCNDLDINFRPNVLEQCDGIDNNCDGLIDDGCTCVEGLTQECGSDIGICQKGTQICSAGNWGSCVGDVTSQAEVCNGLDDNCDGVIDNNLIPELSDNTNGVCVSSFKVCDGIGMQNDYFSIITYEEDETTCDGLDNDCDSEIDEGCTCIDNEMQSCGTNIGECQQGLQTCANNSWGSCVGEVASTIEICDGLDNDCDNDIDEGCNKDGDNYCDCGMSYIFGSDLTGTCLGTNTTDALAIATTCDCNDNNWGVNPGITEICDGLDNNCDSVVDDSCNCVHGEVESCGSNLGQCVAGTRTCISGNWDVCVGEVAPATETCNGLDDNCDTQIDNNLTTPLNPIQAGVCAGSVQVCGGAAGWQDGYFIISTYQSSENLCDGLDNDCDGTTDEGCNEDGDIYCDCNNQFTLGSNLSLICSGTNTTNAAAIANTCDCNDADLNINPGQVEACDQVDNNCNNNIDEGCNCIDGNTQACGSSVGECLEGQQTCVSGNWDSICVGEVTPVVEICDGLDNDCDWNTDDGLVYPSNDNQNGACLGSLKVCNGISGWSNDYSGVTNYEAVEISCDGTDNDCDNTTDEGCNCIDGATQSCGTNIGVCQTGIQTCVSGNWGLDCIGEVAPTAEICDGTDNDCDNTTDEGCNCIDGATQSCGVTDVGACQFGSQACSAGNWGLCVGSVDPVAEICDGIDNNCDNTIDEGCSVCSDDCSSGQTQCSGTQVQTCGNYDADSCLEWSTAIDCPSGQTCSGTSCVSSGCTQETVDINKDGSFSLCGCDGTDGYVCDKDGGSVGDGLCMGSSCINNQPVSAGCVSGACSTTSLNTSVCSFSSSAGWACDNDYVQPGQTFFEQDGICAYQSVANPTSICVTSGSVCRNSSGEFYSSCSECSDGDLCDVVFNEGNFNYTYGTCNGGTCQQTSAPLVFDWRDYNGGNWMSPIKNQGQCGSCWAFATTGVAEAMWNIQEGSPDLDVDLSEQYMVSDCCTNCGGNCDCDGGGHGFNCSTTNESCFPYQTSNSSCGGCANIANEMWDISDYTWISFVPTDVEIKNLIMDKGPLWATMGDANSLQWSTADESWICTNDDESTDINHGVVIVGWDDITGYWIMRNSWGLGYGDQGYHYIKYGECLLGPRYYLNSVIAP